MKTNPRRATAAFSLVELMAVITIIVILAGLVVGGMGFVNERRAKETVRVQMALLSKAIEEYKLDNGTYPATGNSTSGMQSAILFKALYHDGVVDSSKKIYLPELDPATSKQGWTSGTASVTTKIMDPWGIEYRYRTATDPTGKPNADTQNPDFDLWSSGKDGYSNAQNPSADYYDNNAKKGNRDDIRNF